MTARHAIGWFFLGVSSAVCLATVAYAIRVAIRMARDSALWKLETKLHNEIYKLETKLQNEIYGVQTEFRTLSYKVDGVQRELSRS